MRYLPSAWAMREGHSPEITLLRRRRDETLDGMSAVCWSRKQCGTVCTCGRTWLASPHVAQYLDVTRDLLLGSFDTMFLEMVDHELVAPATAAAGVGSPRRLPVLV